MGIEINGKPLKDYIKEQKEKGEVLEMLWQDASEIPDVCNNILIRDFLGKIRRCRKNGDYVEDLDDGLPLLHDDVCEFISIDSLKKKLENGFYDKARRFKKGG